jgi:serine/threonine protein kinase
MARNGAHRYAVGERIDDHITVVGAIDDRGRDPCYIVWHRDAWCPMFCKVFERPAQARWETRTLAGLAHPGIVRLLEDGAPHYMLTEFLDGPSLRRLLRSRPNGRLPLSNALRVAVHAGSALAYLHRRGLVYLDLKPRNIVVARGRPVLVDLGSARRLGSRPPSTPQGTDPYMAPEQARCEAPSSASDAWTFGVTLFEMLAGTRPFPDDDIDPFPQLRMPPTPLRAVLPRVPGVVADLIAWCLAPRPADRPASIEALLPLLNRAIRSGPRMWPESLRLEPTALRP